MYINIIKNYFFRSLYYGGPSYGGPGALDPDSPPPNPVLFLYVFSCRYVRLKLHPNITPASAETQSIARVGTDRRLLMSQRRRWFVDLFILYAATENFMT